MPTNLLKIFIFTAAFLLFFAKGTLFLDPDFGWHLKMGEYITKYGIPQTDLFSYTMPSYPFVDHEWLTNLIIYQLYSIIGGLGLSLLYSIFATTSLILVTKIKFKKTLLAILILVVTELFYYAGIRPQVESWLLFSLLITASFTDKIWQKWRFFVPILILLWANLHGGFAIGVVVILAKFISEYLEDLRVSKIDLGVFIFSVIASLINPYGVRIWWEEWMQFSDPMLRWTIAEWLPMAVRLDLTFWLLATVTTFFVFRYQKQLSYFKKTIYFGLLLATISSARHSPFFVFVALFLFSEILSFFYQEIKNNHYSLRMAKRFSVIFLAVSFTASLLSFYFLKAAILNSEEDLSYPQRAIEYLQTYLNQGQIFSLYGWGGYLIWKLPEKKVFIDGRMASWRGHEVSGESQYAFKEYRDLVYGDQDLNLTFAKYNVTRVLWPTQEQVSSSQTAIKIPFLEQLLNPKSKSFTQKLIDAGWSVVYQDQTSTIYQLVSFKKLSE